MRALPWTIRLALVLAVLVGLLAVLAPWIMPFDPDRTHLLRRLRPPVGFGGTWQHPLGTDQLGRDMLSRCLAGLHLSLLIAFVGSLIGATVGTLIGLISGYLRGPVDAALMLLVDSQLALPYLLIVLVCLAVFGTGIAVLIPLVSLAGWEHYARLVRGQVLSLAERPFVEAAIATGASPARILWRHILPGLRTPLMIQFTLGFPHVLLLESSLSFLGIGVQPPTATLGRMIGEGRQQMLAAWWLVAHPALAILAVALSLQAIGDWLRARGW